MEWLNLAIECVTKKYVTFEGRANRAEFWGFVLLTGVIGGVLNIIFSVLMGITGSSVVAIINYIVTGLYSLAILCPSVAVGVRRMHDLGKGGGWIFIALIPIVGAIWYLVLAARHGEKQENRFGAVPATTVR